MGWPNLHKAEILCCASLADLVDVFESRIDNTAVESRAKVLGVTSSLAILLCLGCQKTYNTLSWAHGPFLHPNIYCCKGSVNSITARVKTSLSIVIVPILFFGALFVKILWQFESVVT